MRRSTGFTLIELMIVVAIIAVIAAIAIPNMMAARLGSNESAAIASLKSIVSAQAVTRTTAVIDQDVDGLGEYGWFAEMGGLIQVRTNTGPNNGPLMRPSSIAESLALVNGAGIVNKSGYFYRLALPSAGGAPVIENANGGSPTGEDPDLCESTWIAYAWPSNFANSGRRAFVVSQAGDICQTDNLGGGGVYQGTANMPAPDAAIESGATGTITGRISLSNLPAPAVDGKTWKPVN